MLRLALFSILFASAVACEIDNSPRRQPVGIPTAQTPPQIPTTAPSAIISSGGARLQSTQHAANIVVGGAQPLARSESAEHKVSLGPVSAQATP